MNYLMNRMLFVDISHVIKALVIAHIYIFLYHTLLDLVFAL